jgi:hypothetical protein
VTECKSGPAVDCTPGATAYGMGAAGSFRDGFLRGRRTLPQKRHERRVVVGVNDTSMSLTRVLILFVRQDGHNVGVGTVVVKILRQCAASRVVELMAEQQDSAATHADLEQGGYHCLHAYHVVTNRRERPCPGLCQSAIG